MDKTQFETLLQKACRHILKQDTSIHESLSPRTLGDLVSGESFRPLEFQFKNLQNIS